MEYKNLNDSLNKNTIRATHNFLTNWEEPDTHMLRKHTSFAHKKEQELTVSPLDAQPLSILKWGQIELWFHVWTQIDHKTLITLPKLRALARSPEFHGSKIMAHGSWLVAQMELATH